jgi:hypothetical protein
MNNPFKTPSALRRATAHFEEAQRELLDAAKWREYYGAMEKMLTERVARLRKDIKLLASKEGEVK